MPAEVVKEASCGHLDVPWPAQINRLVWEGGHDLILSIGQVMLHFCCWPLVILPLLVGVFIYFLYDGVAGFRLAVFCPCFCARMSRKATQYNQATTCGSRRGLCCYAFCLFYIGPTPNYVRFGSDNRLFRTR